MLACRRARHACLLLSCELLPRRKAISNPSSPSGGFQRPDDQPRPLAKVQGRCCGASRAAPAMATLDEQPPFESEAYDQGLGQQPLDHNSFFSPSSCLWFPSIIQNLLCMFYCRGSLFEMCFPLPSSMSKAITSTIRPARQSTKLGTAATRMPTWVARCLSWFQLSTVGCFIYVEEFGEVDFDMLVRRDNAFQHVERP